MDGSVGGENAERANFRRSLRRDGRFVLTVAVCLLLLCLVWAGSAAAAWSDKNLLHNSNRFSGTSKWGGDWGTPTGKYGAIDCTTCHVKGSSNIKRVRTSLTAPDGGDQFPIQADTGSVLFTTSDEDANPAGTGFGDDAGGHATSQRICEACHSQNQYHNYNTANNTAGTDHNNDTDCIVCHLHSQGFKASCETCHGNPPPPLASSTPTGSATAGEHVFHATTRGYECAVCHVNSAGTGATHNNGTISIGFNLFGGSYTGGSYDGQSSAGYQSSNGGSTTTTAANSKSCGSIYCHGSSLTGGSDTTPVWDNATTGACGTCHGASTGTPGTLGSHPEHAGSAVGGRQLPCSDCHKNLTPGAIPSGLASHVNNQADFAFDSAINYIGGSASYSGTTTMLDAYGSCSNLYCHSDVQTSPPGGAPTYATPIWGSAASGACGTCHKKDSAPLMDSGSHTEHVSTYGLACASCHNGAGSGTTKHADRNVDVSINVTYGGTYSGSAAPGNAYGSCSTNKCHSNGLVTPGYTTPTWGSAGSGACGTCHGVLAGTPPSSTPHTMHIGSAAGYQFKCSRCHDSVVNSTTDSTTTPTIKSTSLHANLSRNLQFDSFASGSWNGSQCSNTYCHSPGTSIASPIHGAISWSGSMSCSSCHTGGTSTGPSYASGSPKANSHAKHTASYSCDKCHNATTSNGTSITAAANHANKVYNLSAGSGVSFSVAVQGTPSTATQCSNISCHGGGSATWGSSLTCSSCHGRTTGQGGDLDNFSADSTLAMIDSDEWTARGHGLSSGSNYSDPSGSPNSGAGFVTKAGGGQDPCQWCHDGGASHGIAGANPFRLRQINALGNGPNDACLYCHASSQNSGTYKPVAGFTSSISLAGVVKVDKWHDGANHAVGREGGVFCWDCHDPHGDTSNQIKMVQKYPTRNNTDWVNGVPTGATDIDESTAIVFTNNNVGTGAGAFARTSGTYTQGICNACHTQSASSPKMQHYTSTSSDSHNSGLICTGCHFHSSDTTNEGLAFAAGIDDCKSCHQSGGTAPDVETEFGRNSHHISKTWAQMSNFDCVVCHAEGQLIGGAVKGNASYHNAPVGVVDLYDSDNRSTIYSITLSQLTGKNDAANSSFDSFCFSCHDSGGAAAVTSGNGFPGSYSATNPFGESSNIRTNSYDQVQKNFGAAPASLNVWDAFNPANYSHHAVRAARYTKSTGLAFGQSLYQAGLLSSSVQNYDGTTGMKDDSTLHCNDCHSTAFSAHGSANEYLLSLDNADNPSTEHQFTISGTKTYVCFKCHTESTYATYGSHVGNNQDLENHTSDLTGTNRKSSNEGHITGIACLNCHDGAIGFGGIHGFPNATYPSGPIEKSGTNKGNYNKRRFLPGSSLKYYDPSAAENSGNDSAWETSSPDNSCYTQNTSSAGSSSISGCGKHDAGTSKGVRNTRRPVDY